MNNTLGESVSLSNIINVVDETKKFPFFVVVIVEKDGFSILNIFCFSCSVCDITMCVLFMGVSIKTVNKSEANCLVSYSIRTQF